MPEPEREPSVLERSGEAPEPGKRKNPPGQVKGLQPKTTGREPGHGHASAAIHRALHDVDFPKSRTQLIDEVGDRRIGLGEDQAVRLSQILERMPAAEFADADAVVNLVNERWDSVAELRDLYGGPGR